MRTYYALRGGLKHLNARLARDEGVKVAFLGGSVTEGFGASDPDRTSWRALTGLYLQDRFGEEKVSCINAGVGGTTSSFGAHRLQEHVLTKGDIALLFVEFSINDGDDRSESIRGMEGIVRQCRRLSPATDIVFVYTAAERNLQEGVPFHIAVHEEVAEHYGIPSVNFAAGLYERIHSGEFAWRDLAPDGSHPNDAGYACFAAYAIRLLEAALQGGEVADAGASLEEAPLPEPFEPGNYEYAYMVDATAAVIRDGFISGDRFPQPLINWRYGGGFLDADGLGAELVFTVNGQSAGVCLLCGPDTGIFEYSLDGGEYHPVNLFDEWCLGAYRPVIALFPIDPERRARRVAIRSTGRKDERSTGTRLTILKLLGN